MTRKPTEPGWRRQPMVRWFNPVQLARTGAQALLSGIFGAYADKREMQAALSHDGGQPAIHDFTDEGEVWLDYAADLGDGFDSTYTVAWLLGRNRLPDAPPDASAAEALDAEILGRTQRGRVLVLGGDQVYPTASRAEYGRRFAGPYEAALPWIDEPDRPTLFAIPGNHDWYDGLTSFIRLFCQRRSIGAWKTAQSRSYFALELPHRWWLLGIDIQLSADVDRPQIAYFERVAERMRPGDHVILCTAQPAWVHASQDPAAYDNLAFFERTVLCRRQVKLMVTLTGDLHHYAHYVDSTSERHKITAGGGGAYLYGTHRLPQRLELPKADPDEPGVGATEESKTYERSRIHPDAGTSLRIRFGSLLLGWRNPKFIVFLGLVYSLYAWLLQSASRVHLESGTLVEWLAGQPLSKVGAVVMTTARINVREPLLAATAVVLVFALYRFAKPDAGRPGWFRWFGVLHGVVHLGLIVALSWLFAWVNIAVLGVTVLEAEAVLFFIEMVLIGGPLGSLLFGASLLPGVNFNEAYSSQHIENYRNFLRLHVARTGELTIYPVGIDRVKRWEIDPDAAPGEAYFRPRDGAPPRARLIEEPIVVPGPTAPRVLAHAIVKESS